MLKYKMTDNTLMVNGRVLHQIVALKDFGMIKKVIWVVGLKIIVILAKREKLGLQIMPAFMHPPK